MPSGSHVRVQPSQGSAKESDSFQKPAIPHHVDRVSTSQQDAAHAACHQKYTAPGTYRAVAIDSSPASRKDAHRQRQPAPHGSSHRSSPADAPKRGSNEIAALASRYDVEFPHLQTSSGDSSVRGHNLTPSAAAVANVGTVPRAAPSGSSSNSGEEHSNGIQDCFHRARAAFAAFSKI